MSELTPEDRAIRDSFLSKDGSPMSIRQAYIRNFKEIAPKSIRHWSEASFRRQIPRLEALKVITREGAGYVVDPKKISVEQTLKNVSRGLSDVRESAEHWNSAFYLYLQHWFFTERLPENRVKFQKVIEEWANERSIPDFMWWLTQLRHSPIHALELADRQFEFAYTEADLKAAHNQIDEIHKEEQAHKENNKVTHIRSKKDIAPVGPTNEQWGIVNSILSRLNLPWTGTSSTSTLIEQAREYAIANDFVLDPDTGKWSAPQWMQDTQSR